MSIEVLKQALEALDNIKADCAGCEFEWSNDYPLQAKAAEALRQAIEQAEKQELVAWNGENLTWKLVPTKPTQAMLNEMNLTGREGYDEIMGDGFSASLYYAALIASPPQPKAEKQEPVAWLGEGQLKAMTDLEKQSWIMASREELVADYNIPLYTHPQPKAAVSTEHKQEPVAYVHGDDLDNMLGDRLAFIQRDKSGHRATALYTSPYVATPRQPQKPLTDEWILHLGDIHVGEVNSIYPMSSSDWINFARAIEAAHGIKEQA